MKVQSVLFDLDGTIIDTIYDLAFSLNAVRKTHQLSPLPIDLIRPIVSFGSKKLIELALGMDENHPQFEKARDQLFDTYQNHLSDSAILFPEIENVFHFLEQNNIPWGIVTNKLTAHTLALLQSLELLDRPKCIICGDTLKKSKPDPEPILYACNLIGAHPGRSLYIGDSFTDVLASKAAGTKTLVALYGYIGDIDDPLSWEADGYIQKPKDMITWLQSFKTF